MIPQCAGCKIDLKPHKDRETRRDMGDRPIVVGWWSCPRCRAGRWVVVESAVAPRDPVGRVAIEPHEPGKAAGQPVADRGPGV